MPIKVNPIVDLEIQDAVKSTEKSLRPQQPFLFKRKSLPARESRWLTVVKHDVEYGDMNYMIYNRPGERSGVSPMRGRFLNLDWGKFLPNQAKFQRWNFPLLFVPVLCLD